MTYYLILSNPGTTPAAFVVNPSPSVVQTITVPPSGEVKMAAYSVDHAGSVHVLTAPTLVTPDAIAPLETELIGSGFLLIVGVFAAFIFNRAMSK